jgi:hypothetical protein
LEGEKAGDLVGLAGEMGVGGEGLETEDVPVERSSPA